LLEGTLERKTNVKWAKEPTQNNDKMDRMSEKDRKINCTESRSRAKVRKVSGAVIHIRTRDYRER